MFEKEAEEYFENECPHSYADTEEELKEDVVAAFKSGAEFAYNKANEWHYPSEGKLPKTSGKYLVFTGGEPFMLDYDMETEDFGYWCLDVGDNFGIRDTIFETVTELGEDKVIAWKEIVLPELPKENV